MDGCGLVSRAKRSGRSDVLVSCRPLVAPVVKRVLTGGWPLPNPYLQTPFTTARKMRGFNERTNYSDLTTKVMRSWKEGLGAPEVKFPGLRRANLESLCATRKAAPNDDQSSIIRSSEAHQGYHGRDGPTWPFPSIDVVGPTTETQVHHNEPPAPRFPLCADELYCGIHKFIAHERFWIRDGIDDRETDYKYCGRLGLALSMLCQSPPESIYQCQQPRGGASARYGR